MANNLTVVNTALEQMEQYISNVDVFKQRSVKIFKQEELLSLVEQLNPPMVGIMYAGLRTQRDRSKTGLAPLITIDLYVIGSDSCASPMSKLDMRGTTIEMLDALRDNIKLQVGPGQRKWDFQMEVPAQVDKYLAYIQRWTTVTPIFTS